MRVSNEVRIAIRAGRPVVALESTLISHGLPRPRNLEVGTELERLVRQNGAIPATVGVVDGIPTVGVNPEELRRLASAEDVAKASVRDLPLVMSKGRDAGTTVASTAYLAHTAGIRVFATGGIGGVHRGATETYDESADLGALAGTPITVVSAGVKSVLDVPASLERLETLGITVVGYRTSRMPGFYVVDGGSDLPWRVDSPEEVAGLMIARDELSLRSALLVANPVPDEHQLDPELHRRLLDQALDAAAEKGIRGKDVTPFLLDRIDRYSGGASVDANIWAIRNNVQVGAEIAKAWSSR